MAIINEIKCSRCDRKYSGVRSRCPYCGARRIGRGKYAEHTDNAKGKMLVSVLILAVFTVAAGVLLFTTPVDAQESDDIPDDEISSPSIEDDIETAPGLTAPPPPATVEPTPFETPPPPIEVQSVQIRFGQGAANPDVTIPVGSSEVFSARIEPPGIEDSVDIIWESSNPDGFDAVPSVDGLRVTVTTFARGSEGVGELILRVGDQEARITIRGS